MKSKFDVLDILVIVKGEEYPSKKSSRVPVT
jgi:hypothetical protein